MAFLSRLFKRGDPLAEREEARRQGMRDARRHPLTTFTDPENRPAFVAEVRAHAREQITEAGRRLAALRGHLLERAMAARESILHELDRTDLLPQPPPGDATPSERSTDDAFISIIEARWRRDEARRREAVRQSQENVQRARAAISQCRQEWENALIEHDQEVAAVHARTEQLIAAYRSGVMETHPRREEIPPLWQGEVIAVEPTADSRLGISGREEMQRMHDEVTHQVTEWRTRVLPPELPPSHTRPSLTTGLAPEPDTPSSPEFDATASPEPNAATSPEPEEPATAQAPHETATPAPDTTAQTSSDFADPEPDTTAPATREAPAPEPATTPQAPPDASRPEPDTTAQAPPDASRLEPDLTAQAPSDASHPGPDATAQASPAAPPPATDSATHGNPPPETDSTAHATPPPGTDPTHKLPSPETDSTTQAGRVEDGPGVATQDAVAPIPAPAEASGRDTSPATPAEAAERDTSATTPTEAAERDTSATTPTEAAARHENGVTLAEAAEQHDNGAGGQVTVPQLDEAPPNQGAGNGVPAGEPRRERRRTYSWREAFGDPSATARKDPPGDAGDDGEERSWPR